MSKRSVAYDKLYLGIDLSTQSLTASILTARFAAIHTSTVNFETELPTFTPVQHNGSTKSATSPSRMFVAALDLLLSKMSDAHVPFHHIAALSASAQQHGSVFWNSSSYDMLQNLVPELSLYEQLYSAFAIPDGPIWLDASTGKECKELENSVGGATALAQRTGSRAYERYTGPQIMKIRKEKPEKYRSTRHISLISSFLASIFLGGYAPEDAGDASGMSMMDINSVPPVWDKDCLAAVDPSGELETKLSPAPVLSYKVIGKVCNYFVKKYGFQESCRVVAFSGDNCNTVAGMGLSVDSDWFVSLGTSDVVCTVTQAAVMGTTAHVFRAPLAPLSYLPLVCYANGSLTRQAVRDGNYRALSPAVDNCDGDISAPPERQISAKRRTWGDFDKCVAEAPKGSCVGLFHRVPEICPHTGSTTHPLTYKPSLPLSPFSPTYSALCRAVVESRALAILTHGTVLGFPRPQRVLAAGGAAASKSLLQVLADVLGCRVFTNANAANNGGAAAVGAAVRALHGVLCEDEDRFVPFDEIWDRTEAKNQGLVLAAEPDLAMHHMYAEKILPVFKTAEARVKD